MHRSQSINGTEKLMHNHRSQSINGTEMLNNKHRSQPINGTERLNNNHRSDQCKQISNDQELIQLDPTSCPQNQKGKN